MFCYKDTLNKELQENLPLHIVYKDLTYIMIIICISFYTHSFDCIIHY